MGTAVPIRGRTPFLQSCSLELPMLLQRLAISEVAMVDMAMEDMVAMGATGMERDLLKLKLMLSQDIPEDMEDMDMEDMAAMDVATTERGRLMLSQATTPEVMDGGYGGYGRGYYGKRELDAEPGYYSRGYGWRLWWLRTWLLWKEGG